MADDFELSQPEFVEGPPPQGVSPVQYVASAPPPNLYPVGTEKLTPVQKIYRAARPYVAPALEIAGSVGGGLVGGAAGIIGGPAAVGTGMLGAGLGYGMAKGLERLGDVYVGGYEDPRLTLGQQALQAGTDVATGAALEGGGLVAGKVLGAGIGKAVDLANFSKLRAANTLRGAAAGRDEQILNALKSLGMRQAVSPEIQTTQQALAQEGVKSPAYYTLLERAGLRTPVSAANVAETLAAQETQSLKNIGNITGGGTATEAQNYLKSLKQTLTKETAPMREAALNRANLGQRIADLESRAGSLDAEAASKVAEVRKLVGLGKRAEASAQLDLIEQGLPTAASKYTYKGELSKMADRWADRAANASLEAGVGRNEAQAAADELRYLGIKPLESNNLINAILSKADKTLHPELAGASEAKGLIGKIAQEIEAYTNSGGVIDAKALYAIRKNIINDYVAGATGDPTARKQAAERVMLRIKPLIDDAIEQAGGRGWRQYLDTYSRWSKELDSSSLTAEAQKLWKTNKEGFIRLVQGESPEVVEQFMGPGNIDIAENLASGHLKTLQAEAQKIINSKTATEQAQLGHDALKSVLIDNMALTARIPHFFSRPATVMNKVLSELEVKIGRKSMDMITQAAQSPEKLRDLMMFLPGKERVRIANILSNPQSWGPAGKAIATGEATAVTNSTE